MGRFDHRALGQTIHRLQSSHPLAEYTVLQVIQKSRNGKLSIASVPDPLARPEHVLIINDCSIISAGTEKMLLELSRKSLIGKACQRPDQVRRVLEKMRNEGIFSTVSQVLQKLDEPMTMGYSSAGV